jgi:predicted nucleic acid-binding protein
MRLKRLENIYGINMKRIFLDANVYIIGFKFKETNSALLLEQIERQNLIVTQSDYLYDEVIEYFRRKEGKDIVGRIRKYLLTIPNNEYIDKYVWSLFIQDYKDLVGDVDDLPHICCYFANNCDFFITANRRLTKQKIGKKVNFANPRQFIEHLGLESYDTVNGI